MTFKIIATSRKGRSELCTVPAQWENKGQLRWPRYNADLLSKDSSVQPRADWLTMKCSLKRKNFQTYEEAEEELATMLNKTDTDTDLDQNSCVQICYRSEPNSSATGPNFNSMAQDLINPMDIVAPNQTPTTPVITDAENIIYDYEVVSEGTSRQTENVAVQQSLTTDGPQTLEGINNIYTIQQHIMENQEKIMKKLAEISVKVEELRYYRQPLTVTQLGEAKGMEVESFALRPINDISHLENLEQDLSNKGTFEKLKQQYSIVCSELQGNGINCAYRLLDVLFTKDFLCQCSWTGGSRNATDVKIGFKAFKNVINFFFTMVNFWDSTYTMEHNENFFKTVLRNALKRKNMKNIRSSAKKRRVKRKIDNNNDKSNGQGNSVARENMNENNHQKVDNQIQEEKRKIDNNNDKSNGNGQGNSAAPENMKETSHQKDDNQIEEELDEESLC